MNIRSTKVVIIGAGNVGATCAYTIINEGLCDELCLIDMNKEKAVGEAMDLTHAVHFMNRNMKVSASDYSACKDADVIIITASAPMDTSNDRLTWLTPSKKVMKSIVSSVMETGFNGTFLVVSNPVDLMAYYVWKLSGLPRSQVIARAQRLIRHVCAVRLAICSISIPEMCPPMSWVNTATRKWSPGAPQPSAASS